MIIITKDIENLANLSRIKLTDEEKEKMTSEIESILAYVGQVQNLKAEDIEKNYILENVMRDDVTLNKPGEFTEKLLSLAPQREGNYFKVKKILE
jgi:aspartyl-tRNA(Asn)/glutamyl-tRNA(Gln) amidotransferase subunit C